jgi:hypothetical protein
MAYFKNLIKASGSGCLTAENLEYASAGNSRMIEKNYLVNYNQNDIK